MYNTVLFKETYCIKILKNFAISIDIVRRLWYNIIRKGGGKEMDEIDKLLDIAIKIVTLIILIFEVVDHLTGKNDKDK